MSIKGRNILESQEQATANVPKEAQAWNVEGLKESQCGQSITNDEEKSRRRGQRSEQEPYHGKH